MTNLTLNNNDPIEVEVSIWFSTKIKDNHDLSKVINLSAVKITKPMLMNLPEVSDAYLEETEEHLQYQQGRYRRKLKFVLLLSNDSQVST